jgi:hypothetical protein
MTAYDYGARAQAYGGVPPGAAIPGFEATAQEPQQINTTGIDLLNPTAFPWSSSMGYDFNNAMSQSTGGSQQSSFSGLDANTRNQLTGGILPSLMRTAQSLEGLPGQYRDSGVKLYQSLLKEGLNNALPQALRGLSGNNIISGDIVGDTLATTAAEIIPTIAQQGYQANQDAALMGMQVPQILQSIMNLANYSQGSGVSNQASTSQNYGAGFNQSYQEDQSAMYRNLVDFLSNMDLSLLGG